MAKHRKKQRMYQLLRSRTRSSITNFDRRRPGHEVIIPQHKRFVRTGCTPKYIQRAKDWEQFEKALAKVCKNAERYGTDGEERTMARQALDLIADTFDVSETGSNAARLRYTG